MGILCTQFYIITYTYIVYCIYVESLKDKWEFYSLNFNFGGRQHIGLHFHSGSKISNGLSDYVGTLNLNTAPGF